MFQPAASSNSLLRAKPLKLIDIIDISLHQLLSLNCQWHFVMQWCQKWILTTGFEIIRGRKTSVVEFEKPLSTRFKVFIPPPELGYNHHALISCRFAWCKLISMSPQLDPCLALKNHYNVRNKVPESTVVLWHLPCRGWRKINLKLKYHVFSTMRLRRRSMSSLCRAN